MWFLFGFITLGAFFISSLLWRRRRMWSGEERNAGSSAYELGMTVKDGSVGYAQIAVRCRVGFSFRLTPEDGFDRWAKAVGLTMECETGDARFDDAIYVQSGDPALHRLLETDPALRRAILALQAECENVLGGVKAIEAHDGRAWILAVPRENDVEEIEANCARLVPFLNDFAERLSQQRIGLPPGRDPFPLRATCLLAISSGLFLYGGFAFFFPLHRTFPRMADATPLVILAVLVGICVSALLALAALIWLRRSARTHLVLFELLLIGTSGAIFTAFDRLYDSNIDFDRAAPAMIQASVTRLKETRGRNRYCAMEIVGWPTPATGAFLKIPCHRYRQLTVGQSIDMEQHPGALGWPWVSDFHPR